MRNRVASSGNPTVIGYPAVCFVPTLWIGRHNEWDEFSSTDPSFEVMTEEERHRSDSLGIRIESHADSRITRTAFRAARPLTARLEIEVKG
jgi:hypothetical protein